MRKVVEERWGIRENTMILMIFDTIPTIHMTAKTQPRAMNIVYVYGLSIPAHFVGKFTCEKFK
jgi:hypothetical protein